MLGAAGGIDFSLQLLLPVILVRFLTPEAFGDYRLVWLLATTAIVIFPLSVPQTLFHFLPRATEKERPMLVGNAWLFGVISGSVAAVLLLLTWSWMPPAIRDLQRYSFLVPCFVALWVMGSLIDVLPNADRNARWQAFSMVGLSVVRTTLLGGIVILTQDPWLLLGALCVFALVKQFLIPLYSLTSSTAPGLAVNLPLLIRQVRYAFLFALGNALFALRGRADQWVVASFFDSSVFALISIAAIAGSLSTLIRAPLNHATLPRISELIGQGQIEEARNLQSRVFSALTLVLLPVLALLIVTAPEIIELIYTPTYLGAAPLMQIYLLAQINGIFAVGHLLVVLNAGRLGAIISGVGLITSVTLSLLGVYLMGFTGAVAGSVTSLVIGEIWALIAVSRLMGTSVSGLLQWRIIGRVVGVVLAAGLVALAARATFLVDLHVLVRLMAMSGVFLLTLMAGGLTLGMHKHALDLARGLKRPAR